jgi:hypothetical protein
MKILTPSRIVFDEHRLAYLNVQKPRMNKLSKDHEYSVTILIAKDSDDAKELPTIMTQFCENTMNKVPKRLEKFYRDGDTEKDSQDEPMFPGHYFINARASLEHPPKVYVTDEVAGDEIWSGDYGKVQVNLYAWEYEGRYGVSAGLAGVKITKKGEPMVRTTQESDFD